MPKEEWELKFIEGFSKDFPDKEISFWVLEFGQMGFAVYSEEAGIEGLRILKAYEDIRQAVRNIPTNHIFDPLEIYRKSTTTSKPVTI